MTTTATSTAASLPERHRDFRGFSSSLGSFALTWPGLLLLGVFFVFPLARLFALSFEGGGLVWYTKALTTDGLYLTILRRTFEIAGIVTGCSLVIGYPVAFLLASTTPFWRAIGFAAVMLPLWTSVLVRTYAWMVLLGRNGKRESRTVIGNDPANWAAFAPTPGAKNEIGRAHV